MTKQTIITLISIGLIVVVLGGFPAWARTSLIVMGAVAIAILSYLSSVVYCSNCKKLIDDAEQALPVYEDKKEEVSQKIQ